MYTYASLPEESVKINTSL